MTKLSVYLLVGVLVGVLCLAYASPAENNEVKSIKDLIREKKARSDGIAEAQKEDQDDAEMEEALAQLFTKILEEQAEMQGGELAEKEGFLSFFRKIGRKLKHWGHKVKRFFHRRRG